ncbi:MAG: hypothetical protein ACFHWX_02260 [Bacteroidota bacterium]
MVYKVKIISLISLVLILFSCEQEDTNLQLDIDLESQFTGTFKTLNSDDISGEVTLDISHGTYTSTTNLPYGRGVGQLIVEEQTINFQNTLFFPVPALYGPSYVLGGEYQYTFDGITLTIWRSINVGEIIYQLQRIN